MPDPLPPVLVTDDEPETQGFLRLILERFGIPAVECPTAEEALHMCQTEPIGVLVSDLSKPGMDGFELIARIRANPFTKYIPILIVSSRVGTKDEADKAYALGADRCLA